MRVRSHAKCAWVFEGSLAIEAAVRALALSRALDGCGLCSLPFMSPGFKIGDCAREFATELDGQFAHSARDRLRIPAWCRARTRNTSSDDRSIRKLGVEYVPIILSGRGWTRVLQGIEESGVPKNRGKSQVYLTHTMSVTHGILR